MTPNPAPLRPNGHDEASVGSTPHGSGENFDHPATTGPASVSVDRFDPALLRERVLSFVGTQDGKKNCHLWAGAYYEGYSTTGSAAGEVNNLRVAHSRNLAIRLEAELGKHPLGKFVDDGKETDAKLNVYAALMAGLNFLVIAAGLGVLNIAMASFLIASFALILRP
jgi:hypothetical protein